MKTTGEMGILPIERLCHAKFSMRNTGGQKEMTQHFYDAKRKN